MSTRTIQLTDALHAYLLDVSVRESPLQQRLRAETATLGEVAGMQIAPEQGQFMALLVRLMGARRVLEIGTFTGYSALAMALALPADGRLTACDVSEEWTAIARRYWAEAGVTDRIELRLGPAAGTLAALRGARLDGSYDLAFIDADKENYPSYFEQALALLRSGGLVLLDNMLRDGRVIDPVDTSAGTAAIRALNRSLHGDVRVELSLVPIGDGLTMARKR